MNVVDGVGESVQRISPCIDGGELVKIADAFGQLFEDVARHDERAQVGEVTDGLGQSQELVMVKVKVLQMNEFPNILVQSA